jgi:phage terminase large subunit-like protein
MVLQITTAGWDLEGTICGQQYTYAKRVASGEVDDPAYYSKIIEAPEGADHRDPAVWAQANPSLGTTVQPDFLADQLSKKSEAVFRRYFLNQWTATENFWLPQGAWEACRSDLELDPAQPLFVGLDLSLRNDATAAVSCQRQGDRIVVRPRIWENPYVPTDARYSEWRVPLGEIEVHLRELRDQFPEPASVLDGEPRPGPEFAYDPAYFRDSALRLEGDGLAMTEFPQSDGRMVPACQSLYELVVTGRIAHNGDPALTRHLSNAAAKETGRGWRLTKGRGQRGKIDGAIALAIGTHRVQTAEVVPVMVEPWVIVR